MENFGFLCSRMFNIFLYIFHGIGAVQSIRISEQAVFAAVKGLEGYNITSSVLDVISRKESMTRIDCADQCSTLDHCLSFFHNSITNQCQFHIEPFLENTAATTQAGTVYFYRVGSFYCPTEDGFQILGSNEMCVKFHTDKKTWSDAEDTCKSYSPNGHLAVVDTASKNNLVKDAGRSMNSQFKAAVYIGLTIDGWVDGSPFVYGSGLSFTSGSNECVAYHRTGNWRWMKLSCNFNIFHYVCQI